MFEHRQDQQNTKPLTDAMRIKRAFGDDIASVFLRLRGIHGEPAREALLARYAHRHPAMV